MAGPHGWIMNRSGQHLADHAARFIQLGRSGCATGGKGRCPAAVGFTPPAGEEAGARTAVCGRAAQWPWHAWQLA